jgi:flagellum-specific peptidoglycan hydrolase FlgJ
MMMRNRENFKIPTEILKKQGLKLLLLMVLAIVILKKDFVFSINLTSPRQQAPLHEQRMPTPAPFESSQQKENKITDSQISPISETNKSSIILTDKPNQPSWKTLENIDKEVREAYVRRFAHVAIDEMKKYGIPASITLAQAILQSAAGNNEPALMGHNHFNLECNAEWQGDKMDFNTGKCYKKYPSAWQSFRDHSEHITKGKYSPLKNLDRKDYKGWANALANAGYSTDKNYETYLLKAIKKYNLTRYDY